MLEQIENPSAAGMCETNTMFKKNIHHEKLKISNKSDKCLHSTGSGFVLTVGPPVGVVPFCQFAGF